MSLATAEIVSRNPAEPSDEIGRFRPGGAIEVDRAAAAAREAAREWARTPAARRGEALRRAADEVERRGGELAELVCREVGKPIVEARGEIKRTAAILRYHAGAALDADGETYPSGDPRALLMARRAPRGVAGMITPWNFPLAIPAWKLGPALVHGNACVWKPSDESPACAEALASCLAGVLPEGVVQVVHGRADAGRALAANAAIDCVSFTGSAAAGASVARTVVERGAPVQAEMGGQNASIILADADLERAAAAIARAAMGYAGQKCTATSRVICERTVLDQVREALCGEVRSLVVEEPASEECVVGPLITAGARERALDALGRGFEAGARLVCGAHACECEGHYLAPTLIEVPDPGAELAQEEVFAPVCALLAARDAEEALEIANGVRYGLSTSIFTRDLDRALELAERVDTGLVRVNSPTTGVDFHVPFGGEKASGYGPREQGRVARDFYTRTRTVLVSPSA